MSATSAAQNIINNATKKVAGTSMAAEANAKPTMQSSASTAKDAYSKLTGVPTGAASALGLLSGVADTLSKVAPKGASAAQKILNGTISNTAKAGNIVNGLAAAALPVAAAAVPAGVEAAKKILNGAINNVQYASNVANENLLSRLLSGGTGIAGGTTKTGTTYTAPKIDYGKTVEQGAPNLTPYLEQWRSAAEQQASNSIDYATEQGVNDLRRAEEDAQEQFQTQRNQVDADEAKALDNQALYAEARGDKGGIGAAQYGIIQANAAKNRLAVSQAQTKLSTDVARQISDLRAQGEFEKADALLQIGQSYLSQLMSLKQWAANFAFDVEQYNASIQQWEANYELDVAQLMGYYKGNPTLSMQNFLANQEAADTGTVRLSSGNGSESGSSKSSQPKTSPTPSVSDYDLVVQSIEAQTNRRDKEAIIHEANASGLLKDNEAETLLHKYVH